MGSGSAQKTDHDPRAVGIVAPSTRKDISQMPIHSGLDARRISAGRKSGAQTGDMRRILLAAAARRERRPAAARSTGTKLW